VGMVNPRIVSREGTSVYREGCLSIPGEAEEVERPAVVTVEYLDVDGQLRQLRCEGLLATAVQHEMDHLDGKLYVDHLSPVKRALMRRRANTRKREHLRPPEPPAQAL